MRKIVVIFLSFFIIFTSTLAFAIDEDDGAALIADTLIARPAGLVAIGVGSVFFIVSLPFAVLSGSVGKAAKGYIVEPFKYTFVRPLGDFDPSPCSEENPDSTANEKKDALRE
jgi:hypothetical protein